MYERLKPKASLRSLWDIAKKSWPILLYWDKIMKWANCHRKTPHSYSMFWKERWVTLALEGDLISCLFVMIFACVFSATRQEFLVQALVLKSGVFWWHFANFIILCQYNNVCQLFFVISQRLLFQQPRPSLRIGFVKFWSKCAFLT